MASHLKGGIEGSCHICCQLSNYGVDVNGWFSIYIINAVVSALLFCSMIFLVYKLQKNYVRLRDVMPADPEDHNSIIKGHASVISSPIVSINTAISKGHYRKDGTIKNAMVSHYYIYGQITCIWFLIQILTLISPAGKLFVFLDALLYAGHGYLDNVIIVLGFFKTINKKAVKMSFLTCTVIALLRLSFVVAASVQNQCYWCPVFQPSPKVFWLDLIWLLSYTLIAGFRYVPGSRGKLRPPIYRWVWFLILSYFPATVGSGLLVAKQDVGYCILNAALLIYTACYAPLLYHVLQLDTSYLRKHAPPVEHLNINEISPLLAGQKDGRSLFFKASQSSKSLTVIPHKDVQFIRKIGVGGFGEVYLGKWAGTDVALKRLYAENEEFYREIEVMSKLSHPNIVLLMGISVDRSTSFIVTEYMTRGSVFDLLHKSSIELTSKQLLSMAIDSARGMAYLHSYQPVIMHRDLKSHNLLVGRHFNVKLCDFGLARQQLLDKTMSTVGTVQWIAPEVLREERYSPSADVFSFGVILWELTTGCEPFKGRPLIGVASSVAYRGELLPIPEDCPAKMAELIRECWKQPEQRPSFADILSRLDAFDAQHDILPEGQKTLIRERHSSFPSKTTIEPEQNNHMNNNNNNNNNKEQEEKASGEKTANNNKGVLDDFLQQNKPNKDETRKDPRDQQKTHPS